MGDLTPKDKKGIGNLDDPGVPFNYSGRECGAVPTDESRARCQWTSEIAYKNVERNGARGNDTTELLEEDNRRLRGPQHEDGVDVRHIDPLVEHIDGADRLDAALPELLQTPSAWVGGRAAVHRPGRHPVA